MRIDPAGAPFIAAALAFGLVFGVAGVWALAWPCLILGGGFLFFFRDPDRRSPSDEHIVLSPADGRVLVAGPAMADATPPGSWQQVSIFLSPLDVHVNRIPASGRVTRVAFQRGKFLPAYRRDAATLNERCEVWIDHTGQMIVARQVVGVLARRVVCRVTSGTEVRAGDRFGIMKFGSRMDVFIPPSATIQVKVSDLVRGGETIIAVLH